MAPWLSELPHPFARAVEMEASAGPYDRLKSFRFDRRRVSDDGCSRSERSWPLRRSTHS
jgi:hypothetical protein